MMVVGEKEVKPRSLTYDVETGPVVAKVVVNHFSDGPPFDDGGKDGGVARFITLWVKLPRSTLPFRG